MDGKIGRNGTIDLIQEFAELDGAMAWPALADHRPSGGVVLVPQHQTDQLNEALVRVLSDPVFRKELATRSRAAYQGHFSWSAISRRFATLLRSQ
jgi:glycosyltransferase involved in cell wall biosynthesis